MVRKKLMVSQSNYIPWKGFFDSINTVDEYIIFDDMQYTKRDWRNRNKIKTRNGSCWLSIPVKVSGRYSQKINETVTQEGRWAEKHWKTIQSNYARAKFFHLYQAFLEKLYFDAASISHLSHVNYHFIRTLCSVLGIRTKISWSSDYILQGGRTERLVRLCRQANATDYFSGPAAKNYLDDKMFLNEGITVHYFDYSGYPVYSQLFGEFDHAVSIVDLLLNEGPGATAFMKSFGKSK